MKSYIRILIGTGIVVLVGLAVWQGVKHSPVATVPGTSASPIVLPTASPLVSITPVAIAYGGAPKDWVAYSSASLGFSVAYPPDWRTGVCGPLCVGFAPSTTASGQLVLGIIESTSTIADLLTKAQPYLVAKENIKLGALTWLKLTLRQPQTNATVTSHFIAHGSQLFEFGIATSDASIISIYGRMIASFKFLK